MCAVTLFGPLNTADMVANAAYLRICANPSCGKRFYDN